MAAAVVLLSLIDAWNSTCSARGMMDYGYVVTLDTWFFKQAPYTGLFCAIFISLFLGTEHSDGTMRNKFIVGHSRLDVYLSNFLVCLTADLIFLALWILCEIPCFFTIGPMEMGISGFLVYLLIAVCFTVSVTAVFTLVCTLTTNKAFSVVFALIVWIAMVMIASGLNDRLCEPKTQGGMAYIDGAFVMLDETPNPLYVDGTMRVALECLLELLPTGQQILMTDASVTHPVRQILLSLGLTVLMIFVGIQAFRKKDIK